MSKSLILLYLLLISLPSQVTAEVNVHFMLSVDWEGDTLRESNLTAMRKFNKRYPNFPVIHFLNAAYYTKDWDLAPEEITQKIKSVIKSNDEIGIHIHPWKNFVEASGVEFRNGPSFWNQDFSIGRGGELGDDVPLTVYTKNEIRAQIAYSKKVFKHYGLGTPTSFRGGGWMSGPHVWEALQAEGIYIDSSAIPAEFVSKLYPDTLLANKNRELWSGITPDFFPYKINRQMTQFPNNAGLADYITADELYQQYLALYEDAIATGKSDIYLHFGWHQESAVEFFEHQKSGGLKLVKSNFLERVEKGIDLVRAHAKTNGLSLTPKGFNYFPKKRILSKSRACAKIANSIFFP